jgi:integrase
VNHHVRAAKTLLEWASKPSRRAKYGLHGNEWVELKYLTERPRERIMTEEEFGHLLTQCSDGNVPGAAEDFREILTTLRFTTMRPGELRLLRWEYVQWQHNRIVFPPQVIKTRRRREVVLIERTKRCLLHRRRRLERQGKAVSGYVYPATANDGRGPFDAERPMKQRSLSQRFRRLFLRCVRLGLIEAEKTGERLVPYSTRHTRITELFVEGNDHAVVMHDAGHVIPATTERYKHLAGSHVAASIRAKDSG